jgi:hypothetical protein
MQNAAESAARHRNARNKTTSVPQFKAGDKVLLHNEAVRPQESPKLSQKFAGPFIITQCEPNFNFRLQHLMTGKMLKRPVHDSRLRVFRERDIEFHWSQTFATGLYRALTETPEPTAHAKTHTGDCFGLEFACVTFSETPKMNFVLIIPSAEQLYHI